MLLRVEPAGLARDHTAALVERSDGPGARCAGGRRPAPGAGNWWTMPRFPCGDQYAEQQFLAGFIALRFLKDPTRALIYFQRLGASVSRPISKSRAEYWQGRAYEALGDTASAYGHYRLAAAYPETFYGQLAIARTETAPVLHLNDTAVDAGRQERDRKRSPDAADQGAGRSGPGQTICASSPSAKPKSIRAPRISSIPADPLTDWGYPRDRGAAGQGSELCRRRRCWASPIRSLRLPAYPGPGAAPEPALVLGLIRQETEFDPDAVSSAGARGLMQVMLSAAKTSAQAGAACPIGRAIC